MKERIRVPEKMTRIELEKQSSRWMKRETNNEQDYNTTARIYQKKPLKKASVGTRMGG
jgi:hypothetical protein